MIGDIQLSRDSATTLSAAYKIFLIITILMITNIALIMFSASTTISTTLSLSPILSVTTFSMMGISATLHLIMMILACTGLIITSCKLCTIGKRSTKTIYAFCISIILAYILLCTTATAAALLRYNKTFSIVETIILLLEVPAIILVLYLSRQLGNLTSESRVYFINEIRETGAQNNIYEQIVFPHTRNIFPPITITPPVSRSSSEGTLYEQISLSNSSEESFIPYIDALGSLENMRTATTNL